MAGKKKTLASRLKRKHLLREFPGTPRNGTPFWEASHTTPINSWKFMGSLWEPYGKGSTWKFPSFLAGLVARSSSFAEAAPRGFVARDPWEFAVVEVSSCSD